jgi:hypothetical protein
MPRKAKRVPANPGRPDLNQQPVVTPTGLPYGQNQQLEAAQQAAPLPEAPPTPNFGDALASARSMQFPGQTLGDPTNMPNESVTTGLPVGPGAGPEILAPPPGAPTVAATYQHLADTTGDPTFVALAQMAAAQGA